MTQADRDMALAFAIPVERVYALVFGIGAALAHVAASPYSPVPTVGASGAIAGLMGAFLICFGTSKIRFFYWFFIIWGTFEAPAWLMLPLWLAMEVVSGRSMDVLSQGDGGGGVAHWAHVWGFIFGTALAWAIGLLGIDGRLAARTAVSEPVDTGIADPVPGPVPRRARASRACRVPCQKLQSARYESALSAFHSTETAAPSDPASAQIPTTSRQVLVIRAWPASVGCTPSLAQ